MWNVSHRFYMMENYLVLLEYHKCVFLPLTWKIVPTMNLISGTYHSCERREYAFMILREYIIISPVWSPSLNVMIKDGFGHNPPSLLFKRFILYLIHRSCQLVAIIMQRWQLTFLRCFSKTKQMLAESIQSFIWERVSQN